MNPFRGMAASSRKNELFIQSTKLSDEPSKVEKCLKYEKKQATNERKKDDKH